MRLEILFSIANEHEQCTDVEKLEARLEWPLSGGGSVDRDSVLLGDLLSGGGGGAGGIAPRLTGASFWSGVFGSAMRQRRLSARPRGNPMVGGGSHVYYYNKDDGQVTHLGRSACQKPQTWELLSFRNSLPHIHCP